MPDGAHVAGAHLVGSVPLTDSSEVFRTASEALGSHLRRCPDGETGERSEWVHFQLPILEATPGLEGGEVELPGGLKMPSFRVAAGTRPVAISFGDLRYAEAAIASYDEFRKLKDEGVIPEHMRFQVSLPTPVAVMVWIAAEDRAELEPDYERAMIEELGKILERIPNDELAIQWDICIELLMIVGWPALEPWYEDVWGGSLERIARLASHVPAPTELGFHLCYGDFKHTRQAELDDASDLVRLANAISEAVERPIQWLQLPVPRERDHERYLAPLKGLRLGDETELYLGLVHHTDGLEGTRSRVEIAKRYVRRFGVATECGFGRRPPETVRPLMETHREVAQPIVG